MPADLIAYPRLALKRARSRLGLAWAAREARAIVASYPKSGRTWLRFILSNYLAEVHDLGIDVDLASMFALVPNMAGDDQRGVGAWRRVGLPNGIPLTLVTHERYSRRKARELPVVLMVRNPLDVLVSSYFHRSRHRRQFAGELREFLRDERYGLPDVIAYHNGWAEGLAGHRHLVLSYEDLSAEPVSATSRVVEFLGWPLQAPAVASAVARSTFERMRDLEQATRIPGHSYDVRDADSLRMRQGKVGGHSGVLSGEDVLAAREMLRSGLTPTGKSLLSAYATVWEPS
jgi:Sulfotransferase domain